MPKQQHQWVLSLATQQEQTENLDLTVETQSPKLFESGQTGHEYG